MSSIVILFYFIFYFFAVNTLLFFAIFVVVAPRSPIFVPILMYYTMYQCAAESLHLPYDE